jgi:hypothetical protein
MAVVGPQQKRVGVLVLAPKLKLALELEPGDLRVDDDHGVSS